MNKIVREHYPAQKLPDDLKAGLPENVLVRIEIEPEAELRTAPSLTTLVGTGANVHGSPDAAMAHIRSLRDDR